MADSTLSTERRDGILTIALNRAEALNAWNGAMRAEMKSVFSTIRNDRSVHCVILTGRGRAFSAGGDIKEMEPHRSPATIRDRLRNFLHDVIVPLVELEVPIIAAVNGLAVGAGMSLALAADIIIAAQSSYFSPAFLKVGLIPDACAAYLLTRRVGPARAREWCLRGARISALEAQEVNLVSRVVPDADLMTEALNIAREISAHAPGATRLTKALLRRAERSTLDEMVEFEAAYMAIAASDPNHAEALRAFAEKRPPKFGE
ncbi:2-(1,2-epoxy-1,2-dihydrophenyl)acetyl-CoA isomerase [Methylovirgula ligni]|uniref:2-(1,2-epoxy-1,2-dihydrophenyl)acetyl-CoA isomerase n=1 Tax=Methylovirgula ligni TaxID=569860 RepID=A0A3D9Z2W5_9HYPH|nr:enoyl-CoA hydratase-related protein [Methylovirgula ligni]REF89175.1 2-(1,2-epoxy-1,2-dihydrophenyl)acetyl-CoA isomerase [Methylovirgula ligni]